MKVMFRVSFIICSLAFGFPVVAPLAGPAQVLAAPPQPSTRSFCEISPTIIPGSNIGPLVLGMGAQDARDLLDAAGSKPLIRGGRAPALRELRYTAGPNKGIVYLAKDYRVRLVALLFDTSQTECTTPDGIHLGSSADAVPTGYGSPERTHDLHGSQNARLLIYDGRGIAFSIARISGQDIVVLIEVFGPGTYCQLLATFCR